MGAHLRALVTTAIKGRDAFDRFAFIDGHLD
jgi:hypothetical protein